MSALSDLAHGLPVEGLVPGDADGAVALGAALAGYADLLADAAHALGRVEVSWDGSAGARFRDEFGLQPGRFSAARLFRGGLNGARSERGDSGLGPTRGRSG